MTDVQDRLTRLVPVVDTEAALAGIRHRSTVTRRRRRVIVGSIAAVTVLGAAAAGVILARTGDDDPAVMSDSSKWPEVDDRWTALPPAPVQGLAVWAGEELIVVGDDERSTPDVAAYDPAVGAWRRIEDAPISARTEHAAVWTGTELLVCCGVMHEVGGRTPYGGGAAYDPSVGSWRMIAPAPFVAEHPVAVWTGDKMLITGGITGGGQGQARGTWAYDPPADEWTSLAQAPEIIERDADAVWTGDRLLVWPRQFTDAPPLAYDPVADEWTELPRPPAEVDPEQASMVWTGEELIVWGVSRVDDSDAVGARLDPDDGQWRPMADDPLPPFDRWEGTAGSNSAVWTGTEVVVWTGALGALPWEDAPTPVLAYNPATDHWRELPAASSHGYHPNLIWTGDVVLVVADPVLALRP